MAVLTLVFLVLVFVFGLVSTFLRIPTKKMAGFVRFQSSPTQTSVKNQGSEEKRKDGEECCWRERKAELKSVFETFDKNKDGFITKQELSDSLKKIGMSSSERDVLEMVGRVDVNGDGLIDFEEFCQLFTSREDEDGDGDGDGGLKEAFDVFDGDKNGLISAEELGLVLESLGFKEGKKLEDCREMIGKVDIDGDGMIDFDEFKKMMKNGGALISIS